MEYRVGQGFDIHKLVEGRKLVIGGIEIPHDKGPLAHSDGDILLHALADALLGAIGERDIGYYFPDSSEETKNMDSKKIIIETLKILSEKGYRLLNVDSTIIANKPKLQPYIEKIKESLSNLLNIPKENIGIKAKTTEGFFYTDNGIMAFVVVSVSKV